MHEILGASPARTVLLIAHRLEGVDLMDEVVELAPPRPQRV